MPQSKHKKTRQTNLARRAALPPHNSPDGRDRPEMAENGREMEIFALTFFALTFRQQSALPIVALSPTVAQASRDSGVAERTLRRWLEDPAFHDELDRYRQDSYNLARMQFQASLPDCFSYLAEIAGESDDPAIRIRAIRCMMTFGTKFSEIEEIGARIRDAQEAIEIYSDRSPQA